MSKNPIMPSVGRVVLVRFVGDLGAAYPLECPALVTNVISETEINATAFPDGGAPVPCLGLTYLQDDEVSGPRHVWRWMTYQIQTAAAPPPAGTPTAVPQSAFDEVAPKT